MTYPVKYMTSDFAGAPRCSGTAGDMIALLDACLINGFNLLSVVSISVAGEVATVDFGTAHGYIAGQIVLIDGASPTDLNGEKYVTTVSTSEITFDATGVADGSATGTITCKTAPLGSWEKSHTGVNKAAYKSTDPASSQLNLRVDDTNDYYCVCRGYESMTDIDTGVGVFPSKTQYGNGYVWMKSNYANTDARDWVLIGDSMMFYLFNTWRSGYHVASTYFFGDIVSYKVADAYNCVISGHHNDNTLNEPGNAITWYHVSGEVDLLHIARSHTQVGGGVMCRHSGSVLNPYMGNVSYGLPYPNVANNGLLLHAPVLLTEGSDVLRGYLPGILHPMQSAPLDHLDIVTDIADLPNRRIIMIGTAGDVHYVQGRTAVDITGPWR